jgi:cytochrome c5
MKKALFIFTAMTLMLLQFAFSAFSPAKPADETTKSSVALSSIPDELNTIFKKSCMDCHATGGKSMAMAKLNFSEWDNYSAEKQAKKAAAICKILSKGSMPPKSYRESNPEAVPTAAQKDMICKWSETLAAKK